MPLGCILFVVRWQVSGRYRCVEMALLLVQVVPVHVRKSLGWRVPKKRCTVMLNCFSVLVLFIIKGV